MEAVNMAILRTMCAMFLGFAIGNTITYAATPEMKNAALLKSEAAIIQSYNGSSPTEELDDALSLIGAVKAENPKYIEDFSQLEQELTGVRDAIEGVENEQLYDLVMANAGETLDEFASKHSKPVSKLYSAGIFAVFSAASGLGSALVREDD